MVRARTRQKKSGRTATESSESSPSIPSLLSKAQDLVVQCDYHLARKFAERVLAREDATLTEKHQARETLAVVLLEIGDVDGAKDIFLTLVPPHPEAPYPPPPSAHLYLAQLTDDDPRTALSHYQSAIDILQVRLKGKSISTGNSSEDDADIITNIVRAYLGMIEIWMDPEYDLCVDPSASTNCDLLLSYALQIDPFNLETLQTLASVRLSQEKPDEALLALRTFPPPPTHDDAPASDALDALPIPTRIARAKLLLECGAYTDALSLLDGVLATDDTNVDGWYLMGWTWWLLAQRKQEGDVAAIAGLDEDGRELEWRDMARDARDCLETCQTLHSFQDHPDMPLLEHVKELIRAMDALGIEPSPVEEEVEVSEDEEMEYE